jgi:hypothetical protein
MCHTLTVTIIAFFFSIVTMTFPATTIYSSVGLLLLLLTGWTMMIMMMLYQQQETILPQDSSIRRRLTQQSNKPIVYTFYHEFNAAAGGTGMTTAADQALLQVWVDEWSRAGWNPKILNMEDVRQHPQFQTVDAMLDGLPFKYYDVSKYRDCRDFCVDRIFRNFLTFLLVF